VSLRGGWSRSGRPAQATYAVNRHKCPLPIGTPKGWLSPWLPMGTTGNTNRMGNIHAQTGSNTGTTPSYSSMAFQTLGTPPANGDKCVFTGSISGTTLTVSSVASGALAVGMAVIWDTWNYDGSAPHPTDSTYHIQSGSGSTWTLTGTPTMAPVSSRTMTALSRYQGMNGPGFSLVADPADAAKFAFKATIGFDDRRPSSQAWPPGGSGDVSGATGIRKVLARFEGSDSAGTLGARSTPYMDAFSIYIPAATKAQAGRMDNVLIWQHKNSSGTPGAFMSIYHRNFYWPPSTPPNQPPAGTGNRLVFGSYSGSLAQSYRSVVLDNFAADTWLHFIFRITPGYQSSQNPRNEIWLAVGNAAWSKVVDNTNDNLEANSDSVNRQWCWYVSNDDSYWFDDTGVGGPAQCWDTGEEITSYWKDYTVFPQDLANQNPSTAQLNQWFALMRQR
jgi:hypothetical protein